MNTTPHDDYLCGQLGPRRPARGYCCTLPDVHVLANSAHEAWVDGVRVDTWPSGYEHLNADEAAR